MKSIHLQSIRRPRLQVFRIILFIITVSFGAVSCSNKDQNQANNQTQIEQQFCDCLPDNDITGVLQKELDEFVSKKENFDGEGFIEKVNGWSGRCFIFKGLEIIEINTDVSDVSHFMMFELDSYSGFLGINQYIRVYSQLNDGDFNNFKVGDKIDLNANIKSITDWSGSFYINIDCGVVTFNGKEYEFENDRNPIF